MPVPRPVIDALKRTYPKPEMNSEWLNACYEWVLEDSNLSPNQTNELVEKIGNQLLLSDLDDSMLPNTGLPENITSLAKGRIGKPPNPILVQIVSLTEIGHSAFQLLNVRQTRIDRADLAGLIEAGVEDEEESEPIPKYPRSTLSFELSDGSTVIRAMEYKKMPGLELGVTPLGCKLMLKNVLVISGIAFLEPATVDIFQGSHTEEREAVQDSDFVRALRRKLGQPDPEPEPQPTAPDSTLVNPSNPAPPATAPAPAPRHSSPPAATLAPRPSNPRDADDSFDYFEGEDELDEAYLAELAAIEQRHLSQEQSNPRSNAATNTREEEEYYGLDSDIEMEIIDDPPPPRRMPPKPSTQATGSRGGARPKSTQEEVIEISD
ncbi:hypothetical protein FRC04_010589 [Tulasnella sp. 424]|nr:hypothetical protein FRC04_010589 [Tulasnella sp. 424]KAG8972324.1 hypothetical protein FRC05_010166 [Tulasnella sp. 425]